MPLLQFKLNQGSWTAFLWKCNKSPWESFTKLGRIRLHWATWLQALLLSMNCCARLKFTACVHSWIKEGLVKLWHCDIIIAALDFPACPPTWPQLTSLPNKSPLPFSRRTHSHPLPPSLADRGNPANKHSREKEGRSSGSNVKSAGCVFTARAIYKSTCVRHYGCVVIAIDKSKCTSFWDWAWTWTLNLDSLGFVTNATHRCLNRLAFKYWCMPSFYYKLKILSFYLLCPDRT